MGTDEEIIHGKNAKYIKVTFPKVCFTEIKLSQARTHAKKYGYLGIGFHRDFILSHYGNPVFYVQNGKGGIVVENLDLLRRYVHRDSEGRKQIEVILGFLKNMSEEDDKKLLYYDEMEWRILHSDLLERKGITAKKGEKLVFIFSPQDIKIIVFPSRRVMRRALEDDWLNGNLFRKNMPTLTTISDCSSF